MICPDCKNIGFNSTEEIPKPLRNLGGKVSYDTTDHRRYVCMQCGFRFYTSEVYSHKIGDGKPADTNDPVQEEMKFTDA